MYIKPKETVKRKKEYRSQERMEERNEQTNQHQTLN